MLTKGGEDDSVGARRRRHELAHHDGVRVPGDFRVDFFEAQFAVQVVGRLMMTNTSQEELVEVPLPDDLLGATE